MQQSESDRSDFDEFDEMGAEIMALFQQTAKDRKPYEERMLTSLRQFKGEYEAEEMPTEGSKAYVNVTKQKVKSAAARIIKLLLPNGERNWDIEPTPVPELEAKQGSTRPVSLNDMQETTEGSLAAEQLSIANDRAEAMRKQIADQLGESNYDGTVRAVILDACKLGVGVMKGPVLIGDERRVWRTDPQTGEQRLEVSRTLNPVTKYVNPMYWFPDMSATKPEEREFDFELSFMTKRAVRNLLKFDHYRKDQVKKVLKMSPKETQEKSFSFLTEMESITGGKQIAQDNRYHCIEYYGPVRKEWLLACGCPEEEIDDEADEPFGLMLIIGGHVVMADIHPMSRGESIYDSFNWETDDNSLFGYSVADNARVGQQICNGIWRMMMNNGGLSSGPQVIVRQGKVQPENGRWEMTPHKMWIAQDDTDTMRLDDLFYVFNIPANLNEMLAVYEKAKELVDDSTSLPRLAQGEQGSGVTKTFQGMALLMESANINIAQCVKSFDDRITTPHIARYYDWNMEFNPRPEIKGDQRIIAKGTTALLKRESKMVEIQNLIQIAGTVFAPIANMEEIYKAYLELNDFDPDRFTVKPQEGEEGQPSPEEQAMQAQAQADLQFRQMEMQVRAKELEIRGFEAETDRATKLNDIASRERTTMEKMAAELGMNQQKLDMEEFKELMATDRQAREIAVKAQFGQGL